VFNTITTLISHGGRVYYIYCVTKLPTPLIQTRLIQFEVHGFQQNTVHCTILILLTVIPIMTYAP